MHVGICRLTLLLPENGSLKEKRQVVRSITTRVRNTFNVAIAEVADNDLWQRLTLGVSCVSNDARHANQVLSQVVQFIQQETRGEVELLDYEIELVSGV